MYNCIYWSINYIDSYEDDELHNIVGGWYNGSDSTFVNIDEVANPFHSFSSWTTKYNKLMGFYGLFCTTISMIWKQLVTNILYFWMRIKKIIIKSETQNKMIMKQPILILEMCGKAFSW